MIGGENLIKELRMKRGWSQNELSRRSGVRQGVLSYIESGRTKHPRIDTLEALAGALGVPVSELIKGERKAG